jgi:hypothetical protein
MKHVLESTGTDQTDALQSLYDGADDGDTLTLEPLSGKPFVFAGPVNWAKSKAINIEATGATLKGGTNSITWGAPLGKRGGGVSLRGGMFDCQLVLQNLGYSTLDMQCLTGGLVIHAGDGGACPYLSIRASGGIINSNGPAVTIIQEGSGWINFVTFRDTPFVSKTGSPVIQQTDKTPQWPPSLWCFDRCDFESLGAIYDCGLMQSQVFRDCYFEPAAKFTLGNLDPASRVTFVRPTDGLSFLRDNRVRVEGGNQ